MVVLVVEMSLDGAALPFSRGLPFLCSILSFFFCSDCPILVGHLSASVSPPGVKSDRLTFRHFIARTSHEPTLFLPYRPHKTDDRPVPNKVHNALEACVQTQRCRRRPVFAKCHVESRFPHGRKFHDKSECPGNKRRRQRSVVCPGSSAPCGILNSISNLHRNEQGWL